MRLLKAIFSFWLLVLSSIVFAQPLDYYLQTAALFKQSGEYDKAIPVLLQARSQFKDKRLEQLLAKLYFLNAQPQQALDILLAWQEKDWLDYLYLGLIYEELSRDQEALKYYQQSLALQPTTVALLRSAKIYRAKKQYEKAAQLFSRLLELDSSIRLASYYLGDCLLRMGDYHKAYTYLSKASLFYPDSPIVKKELAKVKEALGEDFFKEKKQEKEKERKATRLPFYTPYVGIPIVRVGLATDIGDFSFSCAGEFLAADAKRSFKGRPEVFYTVDFASEAIVIRDYETKKELARFTSPLHISAIARDGQLGSFYVLDITYGKNTFWHKQIDRIYRGSLEAIASNKKGRLINHISIEEYLQGVLSAEIPARSPAEALRAQAIAARTIAYRNRNRHRKEDFDFCADVHCQVYHGISAETQDTNNAVVDTRGLVMTYQGKPIEAFYHANSGGCLAADVFGKSEYLEAKIDSINQGLLSRSSYEQENWFLAYPDTFSTANKGSAFRWQRIYDSEDFLIIFGFPLQDLRSITIKTQGDCFHNKVINVTTISGTKKLEGDVAIRSYFDDLRSSAFRVELQLSADKTPSRLIFWGAGFGHGAGMSQTGAVSMAEAGYDYQAILKHYYSGMELKQVY